ncbi:MAG: hypothetical protein RDU14_07395 [Melioribacteraceae bacterium]|nr:hypothetical protein [Melioribacteraceae bacterium]
MKKQLIILLFVLIIPQQSFSQVNPGARQIALVHSDISFAEDVFTIFNNPAGLSNISSREIGFFYSPTLYGLTEVRTGSGSYVEPTRFGSFSCGFILYGFELYKETKIAFGYSYKIADKFSLGFTSIYKNISIRNYGSKGFFSINLGGIADLTKKLKLGFVLENLTRTSVGNESNQFPVVFSSGIGYKAFEALTCFLTIIKELNYNPSFRIGAEYSLLKFIQIRFGTSNEPNLFSGGIGILYEFIQADYAFTSHPDLGLSYQFGIVIRF